MQAVLVVPLILSRRSSFAATPSRLRHERGVYTVARLMPSFAAQKLMETSLFWNRPAGGDLLTDHHTAFMNLQRAAPVHTGDLYLQTSPRGSGRSNAARVGADLVHRRLAGAAPSR